MKKLFSLFIVFLCVFSKIHAQYNSVLSEGDWYQISTQKDGIYKLDYSNFLELGVEMNNLSIYSIKIYGNGGGMLPQLNSAFRHNDLVENSIKVYDLNNNGVFENNDYILFYGQSPNTWVFDSSSSLFSHQIHLFSDEVNYYITVDDESNSKNILEKQSLSNPTRIITSFNDFSFYESELENIISSGREWFGERFEYQNSQNFNFSFPNIEENTPVTIKTSVVARSLSTSTFKIAANNTHLTTISVPNIVSTFNTEYAKKIAKSTNYISSSSNININLEYASSDNGAISWLDYLEINARRSLKMHSHSMLFRDASNISEEIGCFKIEDANDGIVWEITDPTNILQLPTIISGNVLEFNDSLNILREYIVFNGTDYLSPVLKGSISNQNLHNIDSDIEYVIVSHPDFLIAASRLADFHSEKDGLKSVIVTPEEIYHEFSSGMQDITAIRDFLKMLYDRPNSQLKYVLLFGDGSYDHKDRIPNNTNFIPTFQSLNSTHPTLTYVTDDYYGLLDDNEGLFLNDLVDIGVGRFPVSTQSEANILVDKIESYYQKESFGSWRNDIAFIADDGDANDGNNFMADSDSLSNIVDDNYSNINIEKIYLDNYLQEATPGGPRSDEAQNAINNRIQKGALLMNYIGHGSPLGWTQERILEISQIQGWNNSNKLPLFMTATCKFSYFDNPEKKSAGEYVLLNESGGAIALLSTTRLVYSDPNYRLNKNFINVLFEKINGDFPRLGDLFKQTKVLSGPGSNNRNFTLLGDPALRLAYPKFNVETTFIADTLKALGEVTIEGNINDNGIILSSFNGTIYPTVYDKEIVRLTLGQESCSPMPYRDQNNILYKGAASVINGEFSFTFIVPKDIAYNYGEGKISYYAFSDGENPIDASGSNESFIIGGISDSIIYDYDGPEINLYMNTREFEDGGITNNDPVLIADFFDFSGINTVGNGIGHDITLVIDGNTNNPYILNEYYEAEKDNYTRGVISFPLFSLPEGEHRLTLKAWDVFNNSAEATINFIVTDNNLTIADYICYPNPFTTSTEFYFQHNKANQELDVVLEIYSISGVLVERIEKQYFDNGYKLGPIIWDGTNNYGEQMSAGMYIAQLSVRSSDGDFMSKSIRLILLPQ